LYRNHPFIIALDAEHHSLLEHPLARQLMSRKWRLYRPLFYLSLILTFLLLFMLTFYVLIVPAPNQKPSIIATLPFIKMSIVPMQWIIVTLAGINLFKIILEIILYRGLRVPFAQLFGIVSFLTSIVAFIPYNKFHETTKWQLAACSILFQWFNSAFILRSIPTIGGFIVMFQSIFIHFISLIFVILPLLFAFTIATRMMFYNHSAFLTNIISLHKLSTMLIGEVDYENLFYSKPVLPAATFIFTPFIMIMTTVFMNLLLGVTVGDIQSCLKDAEAKASKRFEIKYLLVIFISKMLIEFVSLFTLNQHYQVCHG
jgi:hypothetical protein